MRRTVQFIFLYLFLLGCIEPYNFLVEDKKSTLVVEGFISDKSFNETLLYPSDGRYFSIKLSYTSNVTNVWGETIDDAIVQLIDNNGEQISYGSDGKGIYTIRNLEFKAEQGKEYKLQIVISEDDIYESSWQSLPSSEPNPVGNIGFNEVEKQVYKYESSEQVVKTVKGINTYVELSEHHNTKFYKWKFTPQWIYVAPFATSTSPEKKCWAVNPLYLSDYALLVDNKGGYKNNLFFIESIRNERIFEDFSVLIQQYELPENYYYFLKEMQDRSEQAVHRVYQFWRLSGSDIFFINTGKPRPLYSQRYY